jgi:hypothetical protein
LNGQGCPLLAASLAASSLTEEKAWKPWSGPDLSPCFDGVDNKNIAELTTVGEESIPDKRTGELRGPFRVATHIKVPVDDGKELDFELETLTVNNLWALVKKLGIKGYSSGTKFRCHQLIGKHVVYQKAYNSEIRENSTASLNKKLSSELRKIQAFFHPDIFEKILQLIP